MAAVKSMTAAGIIPSDAQVRVFTTLERRLPIVARTATATITAAIKACTQNYLPQSKTAIPHIASILGSGALYAINIAPTAASLKTS
jgi:hypothetical protein